ncbi:MAG: WYL domain-containing protein [Desulfobacteraceae bacterium]|jgi:predicted DNA-binding transcriptional regulator YafY
MRGKNLIQLIKTLSLLSRPQGATRKDLAENLDITDRSVSRCFKTLEELGIPVYNEAIPLEKEKRWHIEPSYLDRLPNLNLPKLALSFSEIISLCMLAGESVVFKGTEIDRHIETAISKLKHFVPEQTQTELAKLKRIFISKTMGSKNYAGQEHIIEILTESILNRTSATITYHAFYTDKISTADIGPLHLFENDGGLYLFALKLSDKTVRTYAIERISRIKPGNQDITYPDTFDPERTLNSAFDLIHGDPITVKILFTPNEARYIQARTWSRTQHMEPHPDGSLTLTMTTSGRRDVKRWIMSFGKEARLLEPGDLKREIEDELKIILSGG